MATDWTSLLTGVLQTAGTNYLANKQADAATEAARIAAQAAQFRPVGVTTRFGTSGFNYDPTTGQLVGAGYQVAPDVAAMREGLMGLAGGALSQAQTQQSFQPAVTQQAQGLFNLGSQFLPTSTSYAVSPEAGQYANFLRQQAAAAAPAGFSAAPTAESQRYANQLAGIAGAALPTSFAAQTSSNIANLQSTLGAEAARLRPTDYSGQATAESQALYNQLARTAGQVMPTSYDTQAAAQRYAQQQQSLLAPQREQQLAQIRNQLQQTGRAGLATGATTAGNLAATNPEMAAYYNAIAQQDAQIAAGAEQQARANLQSDINLATQLGTTGLSALTTSQQQQLSNALQRSGMATGLQTTGATLAEQSANQALQNALSQGQFGTGLLGAGYGATTAAGQQNLANALTLGNFASGQMGTALTAQQQAEELARQRMLSNLSTGTGLFGTAANLLGQGYALQGQALQPFSSAFTAAQGVEQAGLQPLTLGGSLGSSAAQAGAQAAGAARPFTAEALSLQNQNYTAMANALRDPIAQLIKSLTGG